MGYAENNVNIFRFTFIPGVLVFFAFAYGYLLVVAFDGYSPQREIPQWYGAQWITPEEISTSGYFRKNFFLSSQHTTGYLVAAGTDEFSVYINGNTVGTARFFGARVSKVFDITKHLRPGNNLVAISVDNHTRGSRPELAARLVLSNPGGSTNTVVSDASWHVSTRDEYQRLRNADWSSPEFLGLEWSFATVSASTDLYPVYSPRVPEKVYQLLPHGYWLGESDDGRNGALFSREFVVRGGDISDAWLAVGVVGGYSVTLNDLLLYSGSGKSKMMDLFDIGPYLNLGNNRLLIQVESETVLGARLTASGYVETDAGVLDLNSDGSWQTRLGASTSKGVDGMGPVSIISKIQGSMNSRPLSLSYKELETPGTIELRDVKRLLVVATVIFLTTLITVYALYLVVSPLSSNHAWQELETLVLPFFWGTVVIGVLLLIRYDARINIDLPFQTSVLVAIAVSVAIWEGLILFERIIRR